MEWIIDNWMFILIAAVIITMVFLNFSIRRSYGGHESSHGHEGNPGESSTGGAKKGGHGCCH